MAFGFEGVLLRGVLLSYALVQQSQVQQCSMCTCSIIKLIKPMPFIHRPICTQEYDKQPILPFLWVVSHFLFNEHAVVPI
ncbi:hypothetical protein F5051DRAFT_447034 [Lentinula edodes]|nr:hypothetical protein F5051DRAFT_447034 [Lentinula edodes]